MTIFQTGWRKISEPCLLWWGMRWSNFFRQCATSRKVARSIPCGFIGIFHWHNPSGPLWPWGQLSLKQNGYQEYFLGGKGERCLELITLPPSSASCLKFLEPQSPEAQRACTDLNRVCFYPLLVVVGSLSVFDHSSPLSSRTNCVCECHTN